MPSGSVYAEEIAFLSQTHSPCVLWLADELLGYLMDVQFGSTLWAVCFWREREYVGHWRWHTFCDRFLHRPAASTAHSSLVEKKKKDIIIALSVKVTRPIFHKCEYLCFYDSILA